MAWVPYWAFCLVATGFSNRVGVVVDCENLVTKSVASPGWVTDWEGVSVACEEKDCGCCACDDCRVSDCRGCACAFARVHSLPALVICFASERRVSVSRGAEKRDSVTCFALE